MDHARLSKLQPFAGLSESELEAVARVAEEYEEPAGTTLIREGDYGYELIAIEEGTADVVRDGAVVDKIYREKTSATKGYKELSPAVAAMRRRAAVARGGCGGRRGARPFALP